MNTVPPYVGCDRLLNGLVALGAGAFLILCTIIFCWEGAQGEGGQEPTDYIIGLIAGIVVGLIFVTVGLKNFGLFSLFANIGTSEYFSPIQSVTRERPIVRVRIKRIERGDSRVAGSSYGHRDTPAADIFVHHYDIPDHRLCPRHRSIAIRAGIAKSFRASGRVNRLRWSGNDLGLGILERLNNDPSGAVSGELYGWAGALDGVEIRAVPGRWCWVVRSEKDYPSATRWREQIEAVAQKLLEAPIRQTDSQLLDDSHTGTVSSSDMLQTFPLQLLELNQILALLDQRSWLGRQLDHNGKARCLQRIAGLQDALPAIVEELRRCVILQPADTLSSVYVIGSYPWMQNPADIDLFLIVEGEHDWTVFTAKELRRWDISVPHLSADLAVEISGIETLMRAHRGEPVRNAERLCRRHTLLYGSVLLAGEDIFEKTPVTCEALDALRNDLLEDAKRSNWPELDGDIDKIKAKRKWRKTEAKALRKFRSHHFRLVWSRKAGRSSTSTRPQRHRLLLKRGGQR